MNTKPKITAARFGAKVHVHATVTVPTTGFTLTLKPVTPPTNPPELNLVLIPPKRGTPVGDIVSHPEADEDIFVPLEQKKLFVNYDGEAIKVTIKPVKT